MTRALDKRKEVGKPASLIVGLIAVGLGLFETIGGMNMEGFGDPESAGTFPFVAGLATIALGLAILGYWAWARQRVSPGASATPSGEGVRAARAEAASLAIVIGLLAMFAVLLPAFHFRVAGMIFLIAFMLVLGGYRRPALAVVVAVVTTVSVGEVFTKVFRLLLP